MSNIKIKLKEQDIKDIKNICTSFDNNPGNLINALQKVQEHFGYLPAEIQEQVAAHMNVSVAKVYGVVTFYSFFTMVPKGQHPISCCTGTACFVRGADNILKEFENELNIKVGGTTPDGKFSLSTLRCVGACGLAPVVMIGDKTYPRVAPDMVKEIIATY